mmetsp:Transcript_12743/g.16105  ORF Transcript_12743/g.16105 Transcript_12743/m.16105 type:complete len:415 (-) Transcript_12743:228-1472(-)|eukprot:CAMPEP_0172504626 /NCGR_PEP_ID=MMETSP1066-20121228/180431_1 /TAXON_ID=671091 /ORGANISM="Coscinodiscus wailesii, Strain CCMP2513" /LENGTH=414 /DNA_ID=CAMNT_0013280899 /DNA_START=122 /DNA_END=1366 /DNA_ORIENTATION=+
MATPGDNITNKENTEILTQRTIGVLQQCIKKLLHLTKAPPDVLQFRDDLISSLKNDHRHSSLQNDLIHQRTLENRYEELSLQRGHLKVLENKSNYKSVADEMQNVSRMLRESTKSLYRKLRDCEVVNGNLVKVREETERVIDVIRKTVEELEDEDSATRARTTMTGADFPRLLTSEVKGYVSIEKRVEEARVKEVELMNALKKKKADSRLETHDHVTRVRDLKLRINELTEELILLRKGTEVKNYKVEVTAKMDASLLVLKQKEMNLRRDVEEMQNKIIKENEAHDETVNFLRKKTRELENEKKIWKEKYNRHMSDKEMELAKLNNDRDINMETLVGLRRRKEKEIRDKKAAEEAERLAQEHRAAMEKEEEERNFAALLIQRTTREHLRRPKAKAGGKGKPGGKKGKKGKKKSK